MSVCEHVFKTILHFSLLYMLITGLEAYHCKTKAKQPPRHSQSYLETLDCTSKSLTVAEASERLSLV